jgi:hypothetical protein
MTKEQLKEKIQELLETDVDLGFLLVLKKSELETLVASIRERIDRVDYG